MKVQFAFYLLMLVSNAYGQVSNTQKFIGEYNNDLCYSIINTNTNDGYIMTGSSNSFDAGFVDVYSYLVKTDLNGDVQWSKIYWGNKIEEYGRAAVQLNNGDFIVVGYSGNTGVGNNENITILKTDSLGNVLDAQSIGLDLMQRNERAYSVKHTADDGVVISGFTSSYGYNAGSGFNAKNSYILKVDNALNLEWTLVVGKNYNDESNDVIQTSSGGYVSVGYTKSSANEYEVQVVNIDSQGNVLWSKSYGIAGSNLKGFSIKETSNQEFIITGDIRLASSFWDAFLLHIDSTGNVNWFKGIGTANSDYGKSVCVTTDNKFVVTGSTNDLLVFKTDNLGNVEWAKVNEDDEAEEAYEILQSSDNGYILAGKSRNGANITWDYLLLKIASDTSTSCRLKQVTLTTYDTLLTVTSGNDSITQGGVLTSYSMSDSTVIPWDSTDCVVNSTGKMEYIALPSIQISPNPFSHSTTIKYDQLNKNEGYTVTIYNSTGQLVRQLTDIHDEQVRIEKGRLISGLYLIQVRSEGNTVAQGKLIVQ